MKGVEGKQPTPPTGENFVWSRGVRYIMSLGTMGGNTGGVMILVSVGSEFPADIQVQHRVRNPALAERAVQMYGHLPPIVTELHKEAAADLMASASTRLQACTTDLIRICLDVPGKQRSRQYYLYAIENFLKNCHYPVGTFVHIIGEGACVNEFNIVFSLAVISYLGHSEEDTGNWCFKDGTISFQEVFDLYRRCFIGRMLTIVSDCCYSGNWVIDCAKTLDRLGIPPCGHRARVQGILVKVFASCQPDQKATEPCHSVEAVTVLNERIVGTHAKELTQQRSARFDGTRLTCCRAPDSPCPRNTFQHLKWEDGVFKRLPVQQIKRKEGGADKWYYIMLHRASDEYLATFYAQFDRDPALKLSDWGYVLESGQGTDIPQEIQDKVEIWTSVAILR